MKILLNEVKKVKQFINITKSLNEDVDVILGSLVIDGKSILGMFGLDLSKPVEVRIISSDQNIVCKFVEKMERFKID